MISVSTGGSVTVVYLFNLQTETLLSIRLPEPILGTYSSACQVTESLYFIHGGHGTPVSSSAILLDTSTGNIQDLPSSQQSRYEHGSIFFKGNIYLFGGYSSATLVSCEKYSLEARTWQYIDPLPIPAHVTMASQVGDLILVSGYQLASVYSYN